jgi:hypothetical protein
MALEPQVIKKLYGLTLPTLIIGAIVLLIISYGIYGIYIAAIAD